MARTHETTTTNLSGGRARASCSCRRLNFVGPADEARKVAGRHMISKGAEFTDGATTPANVMSQASPDITSMVRRGDYATSAEAALAAVRKAGNQRLVLLAELRKVSPAWGASPTVIGLTDEEAGERAGLLGSCFWKRMGELRSAGWAMWHPDGLKRKGHAGVNRKVSVITEDGIAALTRREGEEVED